VVYWVTNNLLTMAQQSFTAMQKKRREAAAG
jgi:membrane protein insertase Oxa1/YidC/SpoIIIJ